MHSSKSSAPSSIQSRSPSAETMYRKASVAHAEKKRKTSPKDDVEQDEEAELAESTTGGDTTSSEATTATAAVAKKKKVRRVIINTSKTRYHVVRDAAVTMGWILDDDGREDVPPRFQLSAAHSTYMNKLKGYDIDFNAQVIWTDMSVLQQRVSSLKCWQRINHFPSMHIIARKMHLFVRLMRHKALFPDIYDFFPMSWSLKTEMTALTDYLRSLRGKPKTFIMKPNGACQGKGIILTRNPAKEAASLPDSDYTVQLYIHRPLLIEGRKFDMRIYVMVLSVVDVQIFIHREGLVRICTEAYEKPNVKNLNDAQKHLTNYAVNKNAEGFEVNEEGDVHGDVGNKRDLDFLRSFVVAEQGEDAWVNLVRKIDRAVVLTMLSARHELKQVQQSCNMGNAKADGRVCFELLGFDVMCTQTGNVHVLEVNHSPSLFCDSPLDTRIKHRVVTDCFRLIDPYIPGDPKHLNEYTYTKHLGLPSTQTKAEASRGKTNFRQAYPPIDEPLNYASCNPASFSTAPPTTASATSTAEGTAAQPKGSDDEDCLTTPEQLPGALTPIGSMYEEEINDTYDYVMGRSTVAGPQTTVANQQLNRIISRGTMSSSKPAPTCRDEDEDEDEDEDDVSGTAGGTPPPKNDGTTPRQIPMRRGSSGAAAAAAAILARSSSLSGSSDQPPTATATSRLPHRPPSTGSRVLAGGSARIPASTTASGVKNPTPRRPSIKK